MNKVRVAAAQLGVGTDLDENLATCRRMIDRAVREARPDLLVLPEFCNHLAWYDSPAHAYEVSLDLDGAWLQGIGAKATEHGIYLKICVTVRRAQGLATVTNILFGPDGAILGVTDKQTLMGNENNFFTRAREHGPILDLPVGRVGMYACADGLLMETSRLLAVRGAQILLNSLNSFALDEASLHIPARAAENRCFVVAACKVGPLLPDAMMEVVAQRMGISPDWLHGAGESQIVAPDGTVLAIAPRAGEAVVWADIDPAQADDKRRPDGTDVFANRRPALYAPIAQEPKARHYSPGAANAQVACYQPHAQGVAAIEECAAAIKKAALEGVELLVLPELFCYAVNENLASKEMVDRSYQATRAIAEAVDGTDCLVATSLIDSDGVNYWQIGTLLGEQTWCIQPMLHHSQRHPELKGDLADGLQVFWSSMGRIALIVGDDTLYPESFRLAALQEVEIVAAPLTVMEKWELDLGLPERAAENRLSIVAASRAGEHGGSAIITVTEDFTLWAEWKNRPFDGNISYPLITRAPRDAFSGLLRAEVYPACAGNRFVSQKTDLVDGRPWWLCGPLTQ